MKVLVTGSTGFIGSHVAKALMKKHDVTLLVRSPERISPELKSCNIITGNILYEKETNEALNGIDVVFHQAGFSTSKMFNENPKLAWDTNVKGTFNILFASFINGVDRVIYASSSSVYGDLPIPHSESVVPKPVNEYGKSKAMTEKIAIHFFDNYGLKSIGLRYFSVYGMDLLKGLHSNLPTKILLSCKIGKQHPIIDGFENYTRDYVFIDDVVKANICAMSCKNDFGIYNVGYGYNYSLREVTTIIQKVTGFDIQPSFLPTKPQPIHHTLADIISARDELKFRARTNLLTGLKKVWELM